MLTNRLRRSETKRNGWTIASYLVAVAFAAADAVMSLRHLGTPYRFYDSPSYLHLSFIGSTTRLWTTPLLYTLSVNATGRLIAQTALSIACWLVLGFEIRRHLRSEVVRIVALAALCLLALSAPVIDWNRALLSESTAISLTALVIAGWLTFLRRSTGWSLAFLLLATTLWAFTRQAQALLIPLFMLPLYLIARKKVPARRLAAVGVGLMALLSVWAVSASWASSPSFKLGSAADLMQFRSWVDPAERSVLIHEGMPWTPTIDLIPVTPSGIPDGVNQFGDGSAPLRLIADPQLAKWLGSHETDVFRVDFQTHPIDAIVRPISAAPILMTSDAGYAPGLAVPTWVSLWLWGSTGIVGTAFSGGGAASSAHPLVLDVQLVLAIAGVILGWRRRRTLAFVALGTLIFTVIWVEGVWLSEDLELPRLYAPMAVATHIAAIIGIVALVDVVIERLRGWSAGRVSVASE